MTSKPAERPAGPMKTALSSFLHIAAIFVVSAFVLVDRGLTMCDPSFFLPLSCFSAVLAGPIMIESYRQDPEQSARARLYRAVKRATGAMLLILILSLILVNLFFWYGKPTLPTTEACVWAFVLSITAATAAAAGLQLLASHISLNAAKWGFRAMMLAILLVYQSLLPAWTISWYGWVDAWGLSLVAFAGWLLFATTATIAVFLLSRREITKAPTVPGSERFK